MQDEQVLTTFLLLFATLKTLSFILLSCKLGHRCFIAAKCFETFSYVQWEKMPLKIHAEIMKLFNFTVNLSEQVINLSSHCLPLRSIYSLRSSESLSDPAQWDGRQR